MKYLYQIHTGTCRQTTFSSALTHYTYYVSQITVQYDRYGMTVDGTFCTLYGTVEQEYVALYDTSNYIM